MVTLFARLGRLGQWVLPVGLLAGVLLPWAAAPMRAAIPGFIALLLFLAMLRILQRTGSADLASAAVRWPTVLWYVLLAQSLLPLGVFALLSVLQAGPVVVLAGTLVAAAPPISGSPNLVLLLRGDGALALRWLILGTALLPISCLPVLYLLQPGQSVTTMLVPSLVLLCLIGGAVSFAMLTVRHCRRRAIIMNAEAIDGVAALALALMVIGLMSALHDPAYAWRDVALMMALAIAINVLYQCLGVMVSRLTGQRRTVCTATGVVNGNRNIALFLVALPAAQMESLLLFIACYQIPMYLTPLIGARVYARRE